ncbi:MAG: cob(I)yrinic acid a,c-diamide adenosyltransferase [Bacteroidales bacterium]|nr:cob(I)yrinic acid a,c-diamide adenosyltransferase [Bacteroidales bacterium]
MQKGFIHLYSGNGKGKTTAAIGLAIRAVGAGKQILFAQFVKGLPYSEHEALKRFPEIELKIFGRECFIDKDPEPDDYKAARDGFEFLKNHIKQNNFDLIILDEINIALYYKLLEINEVVSTIEVWKQRSELILTGRYPPKELELISDLHTEMLEHKHYYQQGIQARKGIEY